MLMRNHSGSGLPAIGDALAGHLGLFGPLSPAERTGLLALTGSTVRLSANEEITQLGSHASSIVVVLDGVLQRFNDDARGNRQICGLYLRGDAPGLETLQMPIADQGLSALVPSIVGLIPQRKMLDLLAQFPSLQGLMWRETLVQASMLRIWLLRNSIKNAAGQLAHLFCELLIRAKAAGIAQGNSCPLPLSQRHLAEVTGMSVVHVNRTLMVLRADNLIEFANGVLTIHRWDELAEIGEFTPGYLHLGEQAAELAPARPTPVLQSRIEDSFEFIPSRAPTASEEPDAFRRKAADFKQMLKTWSFVSSGIMRGEADDLFEKLTRLANDLHELAGDAPERKATVETLTSLFHRVQLVPDRSKSQA
ncbi:Crp/Fnr family transcriptional regulator [Devosia sp. 1635]|uniref:Crp/Fnr family transcriptional regulator n=1 Tax=Devosia sp. 1635 TaxID=2726066 RepID=UPI0015651DC7|nr:Crp/Fnr family transcriptional regulator [Devosia sp. 1635]